MESCISPGAGRNDKNALCAKKSYYKPSPERAARLKLKREESKEQRKHIQKCIREGAKLKDIDK